MAYLDVSPMIFALRRAPDEFEETAGRLRHIPSRHEFQFDEEGRCQIVAACECADLTVRSDLEPALHATYQNWRATYWRPLVVNSEFAKHFVGRSPAHRWAIKFTGWLHRLALRHSAPQENPISVASVTPLAARR